MTITTVMATVVLVDELPEEAAPTGVSSTQESIEHGETHFDRVGDVSTQESSKLGRTASEPEHTYANEVLRVDDCSNSMNDKALLESTVMLAH